MAGRFSVEAVFKAVDRVTAPVTRMQNRVGKMTRSMDRSFHKLNKTVGQFSTGIKKAGVASAAALTASSLAMANVVSTGAGFEQTLVNAAAKFPGEIKRGTEAFQELEQAAKKTGATTEFTASDAAGALNFLAMAGFNAETAITALPGVVDLATASQMDLATATDIASDALGAFGLATKDADKLGTNLARVNDVLSKTANSANTTVDQLFESMRKAGPVATQAGASIETVATLIGTMANAGTKAEAAGTAVANMFLNFTSPSKKASEVLRRLRVDVNDASGELRDIPDIIGDLNNAMADLSKPKRLAILESIFGREGLAGTATVVSQGADALREYRKTLEASGGSTARLASTMRDTLQGRLNSLSSAIEDVKISLFSMTSGPMAEVVEKMTEWVRVNEKLIATGVGEFIADLINNFSTIVKWGKRIGIAVLAIMALSTVLKALVLTMTVVNLVMAANPIGLIVIGIAALIAGVAALVFWWDDLTAAFMESGDAVDLLVLGIGAMLGPIGMLVAGAALVFKHWEPIAELFSNIGAGISGAFSSVGSLFGFGGNDAEADATGAGGARAQVVSPQDRIARTIDEQRTTHTAEVTIRDDSGRAEVTGGTLGAGLTLQHTGGF